MSKFNNITLIILAGGKSSRMGTDKALLKIKGKTFVQNIYDNLNEYFENVIVSSNNSDVKVVGAKIISDDIKNIGPMGGLYTCLKNIKTDFAFVVTVDSPFVSFDIFYEIYSKSAVYEVAVMKLHNKVNPLIGLYNKSILPILENEIKHKKYKMLKFLEKTNHIIILLNNRFANDLLNINKTDDYKRITSN